MLRMALRIQRVLVATAPCYHECEDEREHDEREGAPEEAGRVRARAIPEAGPQKRGGMFARGEKIERVRIGVAAVLFGVLVAGCGSNANTSEPPPPVTTTVTTKLTTAGTTTPTTTPLEKPMALLLYFLAPDGKLVGVSREVAQTQAPGGAALHELLTEPDGMSTKVPDNLALTISDGSAKVTGASLGGAALAQVVYTLTAFPTVQSVNGKTRADVEGFAPPILVEQPTTGQAVASPMHVTGNANTFEATFDYKLENAAGKVLAKNFVTATSGSGTRGTFEFTVPFSVDAPQDGALRVFELSAEDGSVVHERVIPLRLSP
jgi:germination protein M